MFFETIAKFDTFQLFVGYLMMKLHREMLIGGLFFFTSESSEKVVILIPIDYLLTT